MAKKRETSLDREAVAVWRRNNEILLLLLDAIAPAGLRAVPPGSKGRDVAGQLVHLHQVRAGWIVYHETGKRPARPPYDKTKPPAKAALRKMLGASGKAVEEFLARAFTGTAKVRMFGGSPLRWMTYLVAHDAHHRGLILQALKQNGFRMPDKVAVDGVWGRWIYKA